MDGVSGEAGELGVLGVRGISIVMDVLIENLGFNGEFKDQACMCPGRDAIVLSVIRCRYGIYCWQCY